MENIRITKESGIFTLTVLDQFGKVLRTIMLPSDETIYIDNDYTAEFINDVKAIHGITIIPIKN